ncbi:MAG TPA: beta galactosidase jelly roll domain-containing protein, partial [Chloroflexota bacterium]|nr:beta galactosidase jelly roll domain-containing protein [Chloroflexota bacterium]
MPAMPVAPSIPRPEYPRPQFRRAEWLCLNGTWRFAFDDAGVGLRERWHDPDASFAPTAPGPHEIVVPFPYQAPLSGIGDRSVHPVVWYRRSLSLPAAWRGRRILLHFGAADFRADVWLNGHHLGSHEGGYTPFAFDVTQLLSTPHGEHTLVVRCEDQPSDEQPRGKQDALEHRAYWFAATTGLWQTVWLEPVGSTADGLYLAGCRIVPDLTSGGFLLRPEVSNAGGGPGPSGLMLRAEATFQGRTVGSVEIPVAQGAALLPLQEQRLWSPDGPHLYDLRLRLTDPAGAMLDEVDAYAGLREIRIRGREILLNGAPIYQRQVLDQGYWPDGLYTAPSDDALRADVEWTRRLGFNGARKHQKVE